MADGSQNTFRAFTFEVKGILREIITPANVSLPHHPTSGDHRSEIHQAQALWDTGATNCAITEALVKRVGLKPVSRAMVHGVGGTKEQNVYLLNIYLPNDVAISGIRATGCADTAGKFDLIIGMDIIARGDFALSSAGGKSKVSFRFPAMAAPDFVEELDNLNRSRMAGLGRNQRVRIRNPKTNESREMKWKHAEKFVLEDGWELT